MSVTGSAARCAIVGLVLELVDRPVGGSLWIQHKIDARVSGAGVRVADEGWKHARLERQRPEKIRRETGQRRRGAGIDREQRRPGEGEPALDLVLRLREQRAGRLQDKCAAQTRRDPRDVSRAHLTAGLVARD